MRILAPTATASLAPTAAPRRAASGGFSLEPADSPKTAGGTAALRTVAGIDALLALQGAEDPTERRRRVARRGTIALDALDELKMALLADGPAPAILNRLKAASAGFGESSGDPRLDGVMAEIELRVAVEIAKMSRG